MHPLPHRQQRPAVTPSTKTHATPPKNGGARGLDAAADKYLFSQNGDNIPKLG